MLIILVMKHFLLHYHQTFAVAYLVANLVLHNQSAKNFILADTVALMHSVALMYCSIDALCQSSNVYSAEMFWAVIYWQTFMLYIIPCLDEE